MAGKKLVFQMVNAKLGNQAPRWTELEVENATCPKCHMLMAVGLTREGAIYGFCYHCQQYFTGE